MTVRRVWSACVSKPLCKAVVAVLVVVCTPAALESMESYNSLPLCSLPPEGIIAPFYMLTKTIGTTITTGRTYLVAPASQRVQLLERLQNDVLAAGSLTSAIRESACSEGFPPTGLEDGLDSAFASLEQETPNVPSVVTALTNALLYLSDWIEGEQSSVAAVVGFIWGLAVPSLIQRIDRIDADSGASEGARPTFPEFADQFQRTVHALESSEAEDLMAATLASISELLLVEPTSQETLSAVRDQAQALDAYLLASATLVMSQQVLGRPFSDVPSRALEEARVLVLPFACEEEETEDDAWLGAGLANDVAEQLRLSGEFRHVFLPVEYAPTLSLFEQDDGRIDRLADELGATHVLTGAWSLEEGDVRISWAFRPASEEVPTQVAGSDLHPLSNIHECPGELLEELGEQLGLPLRADAGPGSPDAFEANGRGVSSWVELFTATECAEPLFQAVTYFERALELDPANAQAAYHLGLLSLYIDDNRALLRLQRALSRPGLVDLRLIAAAMSVSDGDRQARTALQLPVGLVRDLKMATALQYYRAAVATMPNNAYYHARIASALSHVGRYEDAVESATRALDRFSCDGALHELLGSLLLTLSLENPGYRASAVRVMEEAIRLGPLDCPLRASSFVECLCREFYMAELAVAYADWLEWAPALHWAREALAHPAGLPEGEEGVIGTMINDRIAQAARDAGKQALQEGDLHASLELFRYALAAAEILGDEERQSVEHGNMALILRQLGEMESAYDEYQNAYRLTVRPSQRTIILHNLAGLLRLLGDPAGADAWLAQARSTLADVPSEDRPKLEAMVFALSAQLAFGRGEVSRAMQDIEQAIAVSPDRNLRFQYRTVRAWFLQQIGMVEESLSSLSALLEELPAISDREIVAAFSLQLLSVLRHSTNLPSSLVALASESMADIAARVDFGRILASILSAQGRSDEAMKVLERVLEMALPGQRELVLGEMGFHLLEQKRYPEALDAFQSALQGVVSEPLATSRAESTPGDAVVYPSLTIELLAGEGAALYELALLEKETSAQRSFHERAEHCLSDALALLDQVRSTTREERYAISLLGAAHGWLFDLSIAQLVDMAAALPDVYAEDKTLLIAEQAKARTTADFLFSFDQNPYSLVLDSPELAGRVHRAGLKIDELRSRRQQESRIAEAERNVSLIETLSNELRTAIEQFEVLWDDVLQTGSGVLLSADLPVVRDSVDKAKAYLDEHEAVFEYMVAEDCVYLWVVTSGDITGPVHLSYDPDELQRDIITLRRSIESKPPDEIAIYEKSVSFYKRLVQPGLDRLDKDKTVERLIIVPSGPLWYLPFCALIMSGLDPVSGDVGGRPPYLVERYELVQLPSLATLPLLTERDRKPIERPLLALADPALSAEQIVALGMEEYQRPELVIGCEAFGECFTGGVDLVFEQAEAQESLSHSDEGVARVLVMACHAVFDPQSPLRSKLLLAPGSAPGAIETDPRKSDGNLYAWEIYLDDHHGTDLVALAGCETLLPAMDRMKGTLAAQSGSNPEDVELSSEQTRDIVAGDELVGLARAFLSSGAASVLGTIWRAQGDAVAEILEKMCTHRQAGETWSRSLCLAQRALINDARYEAVWYWGPYQLIGVWR